MKKLIEPLKYSFVFVVLFLTDQAAKQSAFNGDFGSFLNYLNPVFSKELYRNYNFAFSLELPVVIMFAIYFLLVTGLVLYFIRRQDKTTSLKLAVALILAGALSNIFDRLILGYARDFIAVFWGNIFNLADIFIVLGVLLLLFEPSGSAKI